MLGGRRRGPRPPPFVHGMQVTQVLPDGNAITTEATAEGRPRVVRILFKNGGEGFYEGPPGSERLVAYIPPEGGVQHLRGPRGKEAVFLWVKPQGPCGRVFLMTGQRGAETIAWECFGRQRIWRGAAAA